MAFSYLTEAHNTDTDGDVTTGAVNTTGGTFAVVICPGFTNHPAFDVSLSDSEGNTWNREYLNESDNFFGFVFWSTLTTVGASHTFTATGYIGGNALIGVVVFSGTPDASPHGDQGFSYTNFVNSLSPGAITCSSGDVVVTLLSTSGATIPSGISVDNSFVKVFENPLSGAGRGMAVAYLITGSGTTTPTWSWSGTIGDIFVYGGQFKAGGAAAPTVKKLTALGVG